MRPAPFNVIAAGVGGQGILALTRALWALAERAGLRCHGSTFKGGAQTLGAIHSVLRLFPASEPAFAHYSGEVLGGELDVLLAADPWEALRYRATFGPRTRIHVDRRVAPFVLGPGAAAPTGDPIAALLRTGLPVQVEDHAAAATRRLGSPRMANFLLGLSAVRAGSLPFLVGDYVEAFSATVRLGAAEAARLRGYAASLERSHEPRRTEQTPP